MIKRKNIQKYIFYFILGGCLFCLLHSFSESKNVLICSIIPAIPILFLTGLFFLKNKNANIDKYTILSIKTILIYVIFLFILLYFIRTNISIYKSLIISLFCFILLYIICLFQNLF